MLRDPIALARRLARADEELCAIRRATRELSAAGRIALDRRQDTEMAPLSTDLRSPDARPYFLWSEDLTVAELRRRLKGDDESERLRLLTILLRKARDMDVWEFVTPQEVANALPQVAPRLGRRRAFWEFLIEGWPSDGILPR